jgi:hypothetical protein
MLALAGAGARSAKGPPERDDCLGVEQQPVTNGAPTVQPCIRGGAGI